MESIFNNFLNFTSTGVTGELAALAAAGLWAVASVLYGRLGRTIPPRELNLIKGIIAIALLILTILLRREYFSLVTPLSICLLLLSGVIGIAFGDTVFFAAINALGARRVLLIKTLTPTITALGAMILLRENLNITAWCGVLLTILGVAWVVTERVPVAGDDASQQIWWGVGLSLLAAVAEATGAILSRAALASTNISPLWAALLRLIGGTLILLPWVLLIQDRSTGKTEMSAYKSTKVIAVTFVASFIGTYLGIWLQQTAIKFTSVGIASTLIQTSPLFVLPIAIWMGDKVTWRAVLGVVIAICGVAVLFYWR
ncbi:MAG: DMT family transporter [Nostocaceae cyanobacterium]|nr:DMT family transporter [Nostocaceae cyanobacterium]